MTDGLCKVKNEVQGDDRWEDYYGSNLYTMVPPAIFEQAVADAAVSDSRIYKECDQVRRRCSFLAMSCGSFVITLFLFFPLHVFFSSINQSR